MVNIGVDLGGTSIKIGLVKAGKVLIHTEIEAEADISFADKLPHIKQSIDQLLRDKKLFKSDLGGIGMAFPSIVDSKKMKILSKYVKYADADNIDLQKWARDAWGIPLLLENDARAALVGEWQMGAGRGARNLVFISLGTGVGSAVIIDGKLLKGAHFLAGNLGGHMIINFKGEPCNCGSFGCVETEASGWVLAQKFGDYPGLKQKEWAKDAPISFESIFTQAKKGDMLAKEIRDRCLKAWAAATINLVHAFDPEVIVMGGGIMKSKDQILPFIQEYVDTYTWLPPGTIKIVPAQQVKLAGIIGMAYLLEN